MSTFSVDLSSNHTGHRRNQDQSQPVEATNGANTDSIHSLVPAVQTLIADEEGREGFNKK